MATTMVDQNMDKGVDQGLNPEKGLTRRRSIARLTRTLILATPIFLFLASILVGLGFWATTLQPIFGIVSLGLAIAGGVFTIIIALSMLKA